ncbi:TraB/GumN family protein [Sphingosinicella sp. YJ22]|uniref:TraB/GumN family protein n=1 Tax=Sphingosinicella sp. YJ22 TaxID=1104780 RepID=UPI0014081E1E|nr:TraB/GumN family protein [Sphingosinicella sp. YJ22]
MKKFLIGLLAATTLATTAQAQAQPQGPAAAAPAAPTCAQRHDGDPAMWVARDDDTTIYLFGTFHLLDGCIDWFNDEVREAFDRSNELVMEIVLPDNPAEIQQAMMPLVTRYAVDPQGRKLSDRLSPDQYRALNAALASVGAPAGAFDNFEPWFVNMTLASVMAQRLGMTGEHGAEAVLKRAAAGRNMTIGAVETIEGQIQMFDGLSDEAQLAMLRETLDDMDEMQQVLPRMTAVWRTGDEAGLDRMMNEGLSGNADLRRALLGARNEAWAEWIDERMDRPGVVFMAVGAGHLSGSDSVQSFLARRDIRTERVPNQTPNR